jgi:tetratricopeptide (TPR) repeat protein
VQDQSLIGKRIFLNPILPILLSSLLIAFGLAASAPAADRRTHETHNSISRDLAETDFDIPVQTASGQGGNLQAAEAAVREGEAAYKLGDMDKALAAYKRAYELNPRLYDAALYAGDAEFVKAKKSNDALFRDTHFDAAGTWFAKAIAIDPDRPTAYQYWGDALDAQGKTKEALYKFIDGIIAEPYNNMPYVSLTQWAQRHKMNLGHPKIEPPAPPVNQNGQTTTNIDPRTIRSTENSTDGSTNWPLYNVTRALWAKADFYLNYPGEKQYRHSLKEEAAALRMVAEACARDVRAGKVKTLEPSLAMLVKLNEDGFIEAYVLFARPDEGIARDYPAYRAMNRDKLRQYWLQVVIIAG